jgi:adenosylcobinamide-phosphate synthase
MGRDLARGLVLGAVADVVLADPRRGHPVAAFGRVAAALERRMWADSRPRGAAYATVCLMAAAAAGEAARRSTRDRPLPATLVAAAATWAVLGGTTLAREAGAVADALGDADLQAARRRLPALCGRDTTGLDEKQLSRACVESVAENTSDAVVAPLLWGAAFGVPGLLGYRGVNTLDAMVGYRDGRHRRFGWAAARLDDLANWLPARVTGLLIAVWAPAAGGSARAAWRVLRRDGARHPSPNAGRCEAAMAGALGVRLGGSNRYGGRVENRPELGEGPAPQVTDVHRAVRLSRLVSGSAVILAAALAARPRFPPGERR